MRKLLLGILAASFLAGCATTDMKEQAPAKVEDRKLEPVKPPPVVENNVTTLAPPVIREPEKLDPLKDPKNILSKRSIFYGLDMYDVTDEYRPLLEAHARYLTSNPKARVFIQGNCDERGSSEYNLALGQRRSEGVRKVLNLLGVSDTQMEAVSFGKEKPKAECHEESCWSQNRRSDLVYQGE